MRNTRVLDIAVIIGLVVLVVAALAPAVARVQRSYGEAKCQSNMRRLAEAIAAYTADNNYCYMTNRRFNTGTRIPQNTVNREVSLSPLLIDDDHGDGDPPRFLRGITWIEALHPYVIKTAKARGQDWLSVFRCPNASSAKYPINSTTARVTYVFNFNLLGQNPYDVRDPAKLFMIREVDRLVNSLCRPLLRNTGDPTVPPQCPFLNTFDYYLGQTIPTQHASGSHILFADGHIGYFSTDYFPAQNLCTSTRCWDAETNQWWNYGPGSGVSPPLLKSIAISP